MFASSETGAAPIAAGSGIVIAPDPQRAERRVLAELVSLLFDLNEFIYLD